MITNGVSLSYPGRLERLVEAGVGFVSISFDTADRATAEAMWQAPVFDRVEAALRLVTAHPGEDKARPLNRRLREEA